MATMMKVDHPTRGRGVLETYLSRRRAAMANRLIPKMHRGGRVLDIGCGIFPLFLMTTEFVEKWGVDQIFDSETKMQLSEGHVNLRPFDAQAGGALPFEHETFTAVTMLAVFEHIEPDRLPALLIDVRRVLRPGGVFVMTTPAHWTGGLLNLMARLRFVSNIEIGEHKGAYRHAEIVDALKLAGFDAGHVRVGTFEAGANLWATASK
jgi:SAM-dependent methyltransferase